MNIRQNNAGITIDIYGYNMCHMTKSVIVITVHTTRQKLHFQMDPLWRAFSKNSAFVN